MGAATLLLALAILCPLASAQFGSGGMRCEGRLHGVDGYRLLSHFSRPMSPMQY